MFGVLHVCLQCVDSVLAGWVEVRQRITKWRCYIEPLFLCALEVFAAYVLQLLQTFLTGLCFPFLRCLKSFVYSMQVAMLIHNV